MPGMHICVHEPEGCKIFDRTSAKSPKLMIMHVTTDYITYVL